MAAVNTALTVAPDQAIIDTDEMARASLAPRNAEQALAIEPQLGLAEQYMRDAGLYTVQIHAVNELRARGGSAASYCHNSNESPDQAEEKDVSLRDIFSAISCPPPAGKTRALEAQRIGALPERELDKFLAEVPRKITQKPSISAKNTHHTRRPIFRVVACVRARANVKKRRMRKTRILPMKSDCLGFWMLARTAGHEAGKRTPATMPRPTLAAATVSEER
jgi:hypothetical protein